MSWQIKKNFFAFFLKKNLLSCLIKVKIVHAFHLKETNIQES